MKGWKFEAIIAVGWFLGLFVIGVIFSSIIAIILYFLLRNIFVDSKMDKVKKVKEEPILWDFYTKEDNVHFDQQEMTLTDAKQYAKDFNLRFEEVKE